MRDFPHDCGTVDTYVITVVQLKTAYYLVHTVLEAPISPNVFVIVHTGHCPYHGDVWQRCKTCSA